MIKTTLRALILIILLSGFATLSTASSSSSTWVNFTVHPYNASINNTFNGKISGLFLKEKTSTSLLWQWQNSDENFSNNLVFLDQILVQNGTMENFRATNLISGECHTISILEIGKNGKEGPRVTNKACTKEKPRHHRNNEEKKYYKKILQPITRQRNTISPVTSNIVLNNANTTDDRTKIITLTWWVLGIGILILLILILILLAKRISDREQ